METAYSQAIRDLARLREEHQHTHANRIEEVRRANPDYTRIELALRQQGMALARRILEGKSSISDIETAVRKLQAEKAALLESAGFKKDYLDDIYTCSHCHDKGFDDSGARCECLKRLIADHAVTDSNLTDYMREQTFDRVDYSLFAKQPAENGRQPLAYIKSAYERGLKFAQTFDATHANLLLMGNAGTGKTFFSSCIANYVLQRQKTVYYQSAFRLFDTLEKLKFGRLDGEEQEQAEFLSRYLYDTDLLIIDDLGTEFISAYSTAALFDLISTRQIQGKSTILSTNLNSQGLEQIYSNRLTSRLWGNYEIIPFIGQDLRLQKFQG